LYHGVPHDRHFSAASSFQIGYIARTAHGIERDAGADLAEGASLTGT
jgi:hypothetical protein